MRLNNGIHLAYCTNIHPGEDWQGVFFQLRDHLPKIKEVVSPNKQMGVGLRLSALAAESLCDSYTIGQFEEFLSRSCWHIPQKSKRIDSSRYY